MVDFFLFCSPRVCEIQAQGAGRIWCLVRAALSSTMVLCLLLLHAHIVRKKKQIFSALCVCTCVCVHACVSNPVHASLTQLRRHLSRSCFSLYEDSLLLLPLTPPFPLSSCYWSAEITDVGHRDWKHGTHLSSSAS